VATTTAASTSEVRAGIAARVAAVASLAEHLV
jgi:hypothetical protein